MHVLPTRMPARLPRQGLELLPRPWAVVVFVLLEPLVFTEPVTEKRTVTPATGAPAAFVTVAVTQCCVPTGFVAAFGLSVSFAGPPGKLTTGSPKIARPARKNNP